MSARHSVTFYADDDALVRELATHVQTALDNEEQVVVIATPAHTAALSLALSNVGVDDERASSVLTLDAADTLADCMTDGLPDSRRFDATVGQVIDRVADRGGVWAFGEMVALLWAAGNIDGALALESMWNDLQARRTFDLLCGYPHSALRSGPLPALTDVCGCHTDLVTGRGVDPYLRPGLDSRQATRSEVFLPSPQAAADARHFVGRVLDGFGSGESATDVVLVACELATNAICHAASAFRVSLTRAADTLRLEVEDVSPYRPRHTLAADADTSGRGLALVDGLASEWGHFAAATGGKVVWAEFPA